MYKIFYLLLAALLSGCQIHAGVAIHPNIDKPEYSGNNPIGVVQVTQKLTDKTDIFFQHQSSVPDTEDGYGFNTMGIMTRIK